jgi:hypothetical protein
MGLRLALITLRRVWRALKYLVFLQFDSRSSFLCCRFFRQLASRTVPLRLSSDIRRFTCMASKLRLDLGLPGRLYSVCSCRDRTLYPSSDKVVEWTSHWHQKIYHIRKTLIFPLSEVRSNETLVFRHDSLLGASPA